MPTFPFLVSINWRFWCGLWVTDFDTYDFFWLRTSLAFRRLRFFAVRWNTLQISELNALFFLSDLHSSLHDIYCFTFGLGYFCDTRR